MLSSSSRLFTWLDVKKIKRDVDRSFLIAPVKFCKQNVFQIVVLKHHFNFFLFQTICLVPLCVVLTRRDRCRDRVKAAAAKKIIKKSLPCPSKRPLKQANFLLCLGRSGKNGTHPMWRELLEGTTEKRTDLLCTFRGTSPKRDKMRLVILFSKTQNNLVLLHGYSLRILVWFFLAVDRTV